MKRFLAFIPLVTLFLMFSTTAWAQPRAQCPEKVLDKGTVEGIFAGIECGDFCHAEFIINNGEKFDLLCDEDDANKWFGAVGNKVSVKYEVEQYWEASYVDTIDDGYCARNSVAKSGKILVVGADPEIKRKKEEQEKAWQSAQAQTQVCPYKMTWRRDVNGDVFLTITSIIDLLTINKVVVNRGNCSTMNAGQLNDFLYAMKIVAASVMAGKISESEAKTAVDEMNKKVDISNSLPVELKYGNVLEIFLGKCNLLEANAETDHGNWTTTFTLP